ncbi:hypothetical protein WH96_10340 [Kiloniella spongiae]|uniref:Lipoprotein n=1 Tax=Kiloniella spongiae TaxID=1489064 RepID=A0A0H2MEP5_9PROT|nr:hypothetical protein [Kiloniella spongiae]KLN60853.1 hypothetical protein WH96_10340 [Kiloniella spongiae]
MLKRFISPLVFALFTASCISSGDLTLVRTATYGAYTSGDAVLAANHSPIKIVLQESVSSPEPGAAITSAMEQYGPKWFRATYSSTVADHNTQGYELRWIYNAPINANEDRLCDDDYGNSLEISKEPTHTLLAAFCRKSTFLSSIRATIIEDLNTDKFRKTVGYMGRKLMPIRNPDRIENCRTIEECL